MIHMSCTSGNLGLFYFSSMVRHQFTIKEKERIILSHYKKKILKGRKKLKQGYYSSVKIKFQEYSRSIPGVICFFTRSPILDKTRVYVVKKVYEIIAYDDKNFIIFDYCKQYMSES